ncbi:MAG: hypothetical protein ABI347_02305 [Nitrososphaera sp.]
MDKTGVLYYAAAAATAIAGMLHLMMGPGSLGFNAGQGILFTVGGIAQVFWIIPMVRRWGRVWYSIGIAGTVVFIALWVITRMPANPITGRAGPAGNPIALMIEAAQIIFVALAAAVLAYEVRAKKRMTTTTAEKSSRAAEKTPLETGSRKKKNKHVMVLAGIVVALILIAAFVLPMAMPRGPGGMGGPRPGGAPGSGQPQASSPTAWQQQQIGTTVMA